MDNTGNRKSSAAPAIIVLILALFTAVGVRTFLGPCVHDDGTFGACHWAGQALFGLSLVVAVEGAAAVVLGGAGVRRGLYIAVLLSAVLGLLIPGTLISLCGMATMRCRALMRPAMMILYALMGVSAAAGISDGWRAPFPVLLIRIRERKNMQRYGFLIKSLDRNEEILYHVR